MELMTETALLTIITRLHMAKKMICHYSWAQRNMAQGANVFWVCLPSSSASSLSLFLFFFFFFFPLAVV